MSRRSRQATVRFYFDADILGVGKLISGLRPDCTYPGDPGAVIHKRQRPACPVRSPATPDTEWIGTVTKHGFVAITRDSNILSTPAELAAVREHRARVFTLSGEEAGTLWLQLELLMTRWRRIEEVTEANPTGPWIYGVTRSRGVRQLSLEPRRRGRRAR